MTPYRIRGELSITHNDAVERPVQDALMEHLAIIDSWLLLVTAQELVLPEDIPECCELIQHTESWHPMSRHYSVLVRGVIAGTMTIIEYDRRDMVSRAREIVWEYRGIVYPHWWIQSLRSGFAF